MFKILVCGGRDYNNRVMVNKVLNKQLKKHKELHIIQGGARGADTLAFRWAAMTKSSTRTFSANWDKFGKAAGYIRNSEMLKEGQPDLVIAFPGGRGTAMMVDIARKAGVEVVEIVDD